MSIPTVLDRFPIPPCATLLGLDIIEVCPGDGVVKIVFTAQPAFCNAAGNVQGGFLSAMLDDCMGPAILISSNAQVFPSTIDLHVQFLAPAKPGTLIGTGRVVQIGKTIGFVEAELADVAGTTLARGRASVRLTALPKTVA